MNLLKYVLIFLCVFGTLISFSPGKTKAYSPIVASCSNGVLGNTYMDTSTHKIEQLFEVRLDHYYLDAVAVRVVAIDEPSLATITVTDRDHGVIATTTKMVPMEESWVYIDLNNAPLPRAVYLLQISSGINDPITWKYASGTCIEDSHLIYDGATRLDTDMGFAVYAYDNSNNTVAPAPQAPSTGSTTPVPTSGSTSSVPKSPSNAPSSSSNKVPATSDDTNSLPPSQPSSNSTELTKEDVLKMINADSPKNDFGYFAGLFLMSPLMIIVAQFFSFIIFIGIILLIVMLFKRRNKKSQKLPQDPQN